MSLKTDSGLKHDTASAGVATGVLGALVAASVLVFYWNTAVSIVDKWMTSSSFNHGFLILPVCAFLMWERRSVLAAMKPNGSFVGIAVLFGAVFSWLIGRITGTLVIEQFALVVIIQSAVIAVMGWRFAAAIAFPLFYMLFAVPFGDFLTPSLQSFTALFVDSALRQAGVPVFTDGFMITIPVGNFEVAEICSGLRFLTATTALGVLCANLLYRSWPKRIFFVGLAVTIPIVANGVRAFGIVYMAHTLDSTTAATVDHITYGWVFFSIVTVILLGIGMTFRDKEAQFLSASPAARGGAGMPSAGSNRLLVATTMGAILVLSAGPAFMAYADSKNAAHNVADLRAPTLRYPWRAVETGDPPWRPRYLGADAEVFQRSSHGTNMVDQYIAYYAYQREGAEVVGWKNQPADGGNWRRAGSGSIEAVVDGHPLRVAYTRMVSGRRGRVAWHWYWVDGRYTADPRIAKLLQAKAVLLGGPAAAAAIVISTAYRDSPGEAEKVLGDFLRNSNPLMPLLEKAAGK